MRVSGGQVKDIGLGAYPAVSLKEARQKRDVVALDAANGRELHAYVQQNVIQQSSGSQTPELQGDAERVLVRFQ